MYKWFYLLIYFMSVCCSGRGCVADWGRDRGDGRRWYHRSSDTCGQVYPFV